MPGADADECIPLGKARIARAGTDVTIVAWGRPLHTALEAAVELEKKGVSCEIVDPRTLRPLDGETIIESVKKTNRCVVVHEHWEHGGTGAQIVDIVQREAFDWLDAPILRVHNKDVPMPYAANLENLVLPTVERIVAAVERVTYGR